MIAYNLISTGAIIKFTYCSKKDDIERLFIGATVMIIFKYMFTSELDWIELFKHYRGPNTFTQKDSTVVYGTVAVD